MFQRGTEARARINGKPFPVLGNQVLFDGVSHSTQCAPPPLRSSVIAAATLREVWVRIRTRAGLEGLRLHDLRHSYASVGVNAGMSLPVIGSLLGHTRVETTRRYAHLSDDPVREASERIDSKIAAALDGKPAAGVVPPRGA